MQDPTGTDALFAPLPFFDTAALHAATLTCGWWSLFTVRCR